MTEKLVDINPTSSPFPPYFDARKPPVTQVAIYRLFVYTEKHGYFFRGEYLFQETSLSLQAETLKIIQFNTK